MENQTRFDLNAAVESWRSELATQPPLAPDSRRELETHLRDSFAELKTRGLSDEESFWLARRRVGQPQKLAEEFAKADQTKVWRERVFWMVLCLLGIRLWNILIGSILSAFFSNINFIIHNRLEDILPQWVLFYFPHWLRDLRYPQLIQFLFTIFSILFAVAVVIFVIRGKLEKTCSVLQFALVRRRRFTSIAIMLVVCDYVISNQFFNFLADKKLHGLFIAYNFNNIFWFLGLIAIATWLMPPQSQKAQGYA